MLTDAAFTRRTLRRIPVPVENLTAKVSAAHVFHRHDTLERPAAVSDRRPTRRTFLRPSDSPPYRLRLEPLTRPRFNFCFRHGLHPLNDYT